MVRPSLWAPPVASFRQHVTSPQQQRQSENAVGGRAARLVPVQRSSRSSGEVRRSYMASAHITYVRLSPFLPAPAAFSQGGFHI